MEWIDGWMHAWMDGLHTYSYDPVERSDYALSLLVVQRTGHTHTTRFVRHTHSTTTTTMTRRTINQERRT